MATLQKIRNRAGLLIAIIIGMSIFAFVLQDMLTGGGSSVLNSRVDLAEINGKSVSYDEYVSRLDKITEYYTLRLGQSSLDEETTQSLKEQVWQDILREYTMKDEYKELGIAVSTDELMDMVQGRNPHPVIQSLFSDPQTGILDRSFLLQFIRTMNEDPTGTQKTIWLFLEDQILKDRAFTKYNNLISKGLNVTDLEAENNLQEISHSVDISYVVKRFGSVPDSMISYSNKDIENHYTNHRKEYSQEATRDIEYLVYEVLPSEEDDREAEDWINRMKGEFESVKDVVAMVNMESDSPFDDINYKDGELPETINDFMFSSQPGAVYGPYFENNAYTLARLVEINYLPDSVHARHILLQPDASRDANAVILLADSLKEELENGGDFDRLASLYGSDATAQTGGDLGWFSEGDMVHPFGDSCFYGETGKIMTVQTQYGIHITQVLEKSRNVKKVKVAYLSRNVEPSSETYQNKYAEAVKFAGLNNTYEKFNTAVSQQNLTVRYANDLTENQRTITGLESPRELVRWAFDADLHEVSNEIFEFGNKYVIAVVTGIREKGIAPLEQIRPEIVLEVKKNKKAEIIMDEFTSRMKDVSGIEELAGQMNLNVEEADNINFTSVSLPAAGIEPGVIAMAGILEQGKLSPPVKGNNGVYVLVVIASREQENEPDLASNRARMTAALESQANYEAYDALMEASDIKDNRSAYY